MFLFTAHFLFPFICIIPSSSLASQIEGGEDCLKGIAVEGEEVVEHSDEHHLQLRRTLRRTPPATLANTPTVTTSDNKVNPNSPSSLPSPRFFFFLPIHIELFICMRGAY
ncbi:hypothetical protein Dimus_029185 [Dionaea muscipula]